MTIYLMKYKESFSHIFDIMTASDLEMKGARTPGAIVSVYWHIYLR